ncbi:hypothetical protein VV01_15630 [Luteipulveratus halotolerans]|uniref:Uncharacterized protein n=1 Tax=Luteipulveratus halotolerans TaxID=1631356 RepID=A0A0L6CKF0_9MICO|nr:hypothetical protein VV01_15630 [Luteipulveratus halotolerans]
MALVAVGAAVAVGKLTVPGTATPRRTGGEAHHAHSPGSPAAAASATPGEATLAACQAEVRAGGRLASAAASSAEQYRTHTRAQVDVDAGRISAKTAARRWADSKKFGPRDVHEFASADRAYTAVAGTCERLQGSSGTQQACKAHARALGQAARTARPVNNGWAHHLEMMKSKPHDEAAKTFAEYMATWRGMVKDAGPQLSAYDTAAKDLAAAPRCQGA